MVIIPDSPMAPSFRQHICGKTPIERCIGCNTHFLCYMLFVTLTAFFLTICSENEQGIVRMERLNLVRTSCYLDPCNTAIICCGLLFAGEEKKRGPFAGDCGLLVEEERFDKGCPRLHQKNCASNTPKHYSTHPLRQIEPFPPFLP